jgi:hypothetical protein
LKNPQRSTGVSVYAGRTGAITRSFKAVKVREYRNHRNWFMFFAFLAAMWTFAPVAWWQRAIAVAALAFFGFYTYRLNKGVRIWKRMPTSD